MLVVVVSVVVVGGVVVVVLVVVGVLVEVVEVDVLEVAVLAVGVVVAVVWWHCWLARSRTVEPPWSRSALSVRVDRAGQVGDGVVERLRGVHCGRAVAGPDRRLDLIELGRERVGLVA